MRGHVFLRGRLICEERLRPLGNVHAWDTYILRLGFDCVFREGLLVGHHKNRRYMGHCMWDSLARKGPRGTDLSYLGPFRLLNFVMGPVALISTYLLI